MRNDTEACNSFDKFYSINNLIKDLHDLKIQISKV